MERISVLTKLPVFPAVAARLMRMLYNERVSFQEVSALVGADAALTAEVLRMANSPLTGAASQVNSLNQAMVLLGLERLNALVLTVSLCKFVAPAAKCKSLALCWRHNLATATVAEQLARKYRESADAAYTAGILHDVGRLALLVAEPVEYDRLLIATGQAADAFTSAELMEAERREFGVDHCEAGRLVVARWGFPQEFGEYTSEHHQPKKGARTMTLLVHAACEIADMIGFQVCGPTAEWNLEAIEPALPEGTAEALDAAELKWQIADRINALETAGFATAEA
jgi:putative nucleotidyltransferase with HDIG domain